VNITLDEVLARIPEEYRPLAVQYGPTILKMSADAIWAWVELLLAGNTRAAMETIIARMPPSELLTRMTANLAAWDEANAANARAVALQREAALAVLRVLLGIALAAVGL
jgi:hypothetical protein